MSVLNKVLYMRALDTFVNKDWVYGLLNLWFDSRWVEPYLTTNFQIADYSFIDGFINIVNKLELIWLNKCKWLIA